VIGDVTIAALDQPKEFFSLRISAKLGFGAIESAEPETGVCALKNPPYSTTLHHQTKKPQEPQLRMRILLVLSVLLFPLTLQAQWTHRYPQADGFDHQVYLEGFELPILSSGPIDPAPSPMGDELAFSAKGWLWLLDLESGVAQRVTSSSHMDSRPEWSPSGDQLVFIRDTRSQLEIVSVDLDSSDETVLVDVEAIHLDPVFSPDGKYVYYASAEGGPLEIWRVSLESLERQKLTDIAAGKKRALARRPQIVDQDSLILFLYKSGYYDSIELLNTVTGSRSVLLEDWITSQADIALSPDRRHLAYSWPADGGHELRVMALSDPSTSVLLTRSEGMPVAPAFSHDGAWLYFAEANDNERTELKRVRLSGGAVEPVAVKRMEWGVPTGKLIIRSEVDGNVAPVRMSALDASGHPVIPETGAVRFEGQNGRVFFYSNGEIELIAPAGEVILSAVHGFETPEATQTVTVEENATTTATLRLTRVWDASENGWLSADTHFHLNYGGIYRLDPGDIVLDLEAEAVDIAFPLLANLHNRFLEQDLRDWRRKKKPLIEFGQEIRSHFLGHLGLIGVDDLFWPWIWGPGYQVYGTDDRPNVKALRHARARGGLGGYVHPVAKDDPFTEEAPIPKGFVADAVLGEVDLIELACLWTDERGTAKLWHSMLNLGVPLAASAGSDVMNDYYRTMAIGATRVYVKPEGELNAGAFLSALKGGKSFVSNGPMLEFAVDGRGPGEIIENGDKAARWTLSVYSALPVDHVEIFVNGKVVQTLDGNPVAGHKVYEGSVDVPSGGWISARVTGTNTGWPALDSYLFAESSPVWFSAVGSTDPDVARESAETLLGALDVAEKNVKKGYGNAPIPKILEHFDKARGHLRAMASDR
jgi:TolB protein